MGLLEKLVNNEPNSRVLPTSRVGYHVGKPMESVVYCLTNREWVHYREISDRGLARSIHQDRGLRFSCNDRTDEAVTHLCSTLTVVTDDCHTSAILVSHITMYSKWCQASLAVWINDIISAYTAEVSSYYRTGKSNWGFDFYLSFYCWKSICRFTGVRSLVRFFDINKDKSTIPKDTWSYRKWG